MCFHYSPKPDKDVETKTQGKLNIETSFKEGNVEERLPHAAFWGGSFINNLVRYENINLVEKKKEN